MYSWEIQNYLEEIDYHSTHSKIREIMIKSPQIRLFKLLELGEPTSKYQLFTDDNYEWTVHLDNFS